MLDCVEMLLEHMFATREPLLRSLRKLPKEDLVRSLGPSERSIHDLLTHLMSTDVFWLNVINNEDTPPLDAAQLDSIDDIERTWKAIEREMRETFYSQTGSSIQHVRRLRVNQDTISFTIARAFLHLVTHEAHHRGFIVGLLMEMGYDVPNLNMLRELT